MASILNADTSNGLKLTSDTSGEIELQANGVTKAKVTANGLQDANGNSLRGGMYRNLIINGDMKIAQRGTSVSGLSSGSGYQTVDRFQFDTDGTIGTWTMSQDTDVPTGQGFSNSVKYTCTASATISSNAQLRMNHYIEAQNLQHLKYGTANAESITLSFWVKSNKTGTFAIWTYAIDGTRVISNLVTISSADTWEKKTITIAGDTSGTINNDNGAGLLIVFQFVAGTNLTSGTLASSWESIVAANLAAGQTINLADSTSNYINITGVQLEIGEGGASDFEFLPYDVQLQRCFRYFEKRTNYIETTAPTGINAYSQWIFKTRMRANPTITNTGGVGTVSNISVDGATSYANAYSNFFDTAKADAEL